MCIHELALAYTESKWSTSFEPLILGRVCHFCMLLTGIQAEWDWTPIRTFGGGDLGDSHLFTSAEIFLRGREAHEAEHLT
jgi:hypothetical protein